MYEDTLGEDGKTVFKMNKFRRGAHSQPLKRTQANSPTPCKDCPKQPADLAPADRTPATAIERLNERNHQAYQFYLDHRAVGWFPDDALVRRNAAIIRQEEDHAAELRRIRLGALS